MWILTISKYKNKIVDSRIIFVSFLVKAKLGLNREDLHWELWEILDLENKEWRNWSRNKWKCSNSGLQRVKENPLTLSTSSICQFWMLFGEFQWGTNMNMTIPDCCLLLKGWQKVWRDLDGQKMSFFSLFHSWASYFQTSWEERRLKGEKKSNQLK